MKVHRRLQIIGDSEKTSTTRKIVMRLSLRSVVVSGTICSYNFRITFTPLLNLLGILRRDQSDVSTWANWQRKLFILSKICSLILIFPCTWKRRFWFSVSGLWNNVHLHGCTRMGMSFKDDEKGATPLCCTLWWWSLRYEAHELPETNESTRVRRTWLIHIRIKDIMVNIYRMNSVQRIWCAVYMRARTQECTSAAATADRREGFWSSPVFSSSPPSVFLFLLWLEELWRVGSGRRGEEWRRHGGTAGNIRGRVRGDKGEAGGEREEGGSWGRPG